VLLDIYQSFRREHLDAADAADAADADAAPLVAGMVGD
jgi:hypothetical protein